MIRFSISEELLLELKALRAARRARLAVERSRANAAPVALDQLLIRADGPPAIPHLAADYVAGMDALQRAVEEEFDAFLLDPGMGPMTYLTSDGRVIFDSRTWDGSGLQFAETVDEAISALVVGAKKTGIEALLGVIPALIGANSCPKCDGRRWAKPSAAFDADVVCLVCRGRGQVDQRLVSEAKGRGWL